MVAIRNQTSTPFKVDASSLVTGGSLNGALFFRTKTQIHSPTHHVFSMCPLHKGHVCKNIVRALHMSAAKDKTYCLSSMHPPMVKKG